MDEQELIAKYRKQLESSNEEAPEGLWNDIANSLDIDDVWNNIAAELDSEKRTRPVTWINTYWAASILLFISLGISGLWFINQKNNYGSKITAPPSSTTHKNIISKTLHGQSPIVTNHFNTKSKSQHTDNSSNGRVLNKNYNLISYENVTKDLNIDNQRPGITNIKKIVPLKATITTIETLHSQQLIIAQTDVVSPRQRFNNLYIGITSAVKNTWLYSEETINGLNKNNLTTPELNIYLDFGINFMYEFGPRWRAEGNVFFKSRTGQSYKKYLYGRYINKDISLNYTQVELSAKYISSKRWIKSTAFNFTNAFGLYYSTLNSVFESSAFSRYNNKDYGIVLGNNIDILLANRIILSPGYRIKWGITNIYAGETNIPASFNNTHNASLEFRFTIYYNIMKLKQQKAKVLPEKN